MTMKKILSTMLMLAMVLSMLGTIVLKPTKANASDYITIDDIPSANEIHTIDFDDKDYQAEYGYPYLWGSNTAGFKSVKAVAPEDYVTIGKTGYTAKLKLVNDPVDGTDKALSFETVIGKAIVTEEEKAKMTISVNHNGSTVNAMLGEVYTPSTGEVAPCYVYGETGSTKYWVTKSDSYTEQELAQGNVGTASGSANNRFTYDGKGVSADLGWTSVVFPEIKNPIKDADGNVVGVYSAGFKFHYSKLSGASNLSFQFTPASGKSYSFNILSNQIHSETASLEVWTSESTHAALGGKSSYRFGKTADTTGVITDASQLNVVTSFKADDWNDFLIVSYFEDEIFRIYVNGKPLFMQTTKDGNTIYTSDFYLPRASVMPEFIARQVKLRSGLESTVSIDDIVVKYDAETIESVLTWKKISNNQAIDTVISDLNILESIVIGGQTHNVIWESSDEDVISTKGKVTRGDFDETVILTATANGKSVSFEVTVKGTVGNTTIYLAGDSTMCDYGENYYPQQGWGYFFEDYFKENIIVVNAAAGGQSAKTFYTDPARFEKSIYNKLIEGDYVFISFGINDAYKLDTNDDETDNSKYTYNYIDSEGASQSIYPAGSDITEYTEYIDKMCDAVIQKQAKPVLVTPCNVGGNRNSCSAYVEAMRNYATDNNIPLVDLNKSHNDYINLVKPLSITPEAEQTGEAVPTYVKEEMNLYNMVERGFLTEEELTNHPNSTFKNSGTGTDLIHLSENGAQILARWVAQEIYKSEDNALISLANQMLPEEIQSTIYTAGDSLMFSWSRWWSLGYYPYQGWGAYIDKYMDGVKVNNTAMSGETTASFYYQEAYMPTIRKSLKHGDYLFVSLGTNDSSYQNDNNKFVPNVTDENGNPIKWGATVEEYESNLIMYIEDMRKRNVNIVFVTSPTFNTYDSCYAYFDKMRELSEEYDVPLIDVRAAHLDYIDKRYPEKIFSRGTALPDDLKNEFYMTQSALKNTFAFTDEMIRNHPQGSGMLSQNGGKGDYTHFNIAGAKKIANIAMGALRDATDPELDELKSFLNLEAFYETDDSVYDELSIISYSETGGIMVYNPKEEYTDVNLIAVSYDKNKKVKCVVVDEQADIQANGTTILQVPDGFTTKNADIVKIFVFKDISPLCRSLKIEQ